MDSVVCDVYSVYTDRSRKVANRVYESFYAVELVNYIIPLSSIRDNPPSGTLTVKGMRLVADMIDRMVRP